MKYWETVIKNLCDYEAPYRFTSVIVPRYYHEMSLHDYGDMTQYCLNSTV